MQVNIKAGQPDHTSERIADLICMGAPVLMRFRGEDVSVCHRAGRIGAPDASAKG